MKVLINAMIFLFCTGNLGAGYYDDFLKRIERAVDKWNIDSLKVLYEEARENVELDDTEEMRTLFEIMSFWIASYYWSEDKDSTRYYYEKAVSFIESIDENGRSSNDWAFLGYFYGNLIPLKSFLNAPSLSVKSKNAFERALERSSDNPRAYLLKGISTYHTPKAFGGGPTKALPFFEEALKFYKEDRGPVKWGRRVAVVYKAKILKKLGREEEAISLLKALLKEYPNYGWAKSLLARWEGNEK